MTNRNLYALAFALIVLALISRTVAAEEPQIGLLRISAVQSPRQVAPSTEAHFAVDVEYATYTNVSIRAAIFEGSVNNLGTQLWRSDSVLVSGGGDQILECHSAVSLC